MENEALGARTRGVEVDHAEKRPRTTIAISSSSSTNTTTAATTTATTTAMTAAATMQTGEALPVPPPPLSVEGGGGDADTGAVVVTPLQQIAEARIRVAPGAPLPPSPQTEDSAEPRVLSPAALPSGHASTSMGGGRSSRGSRSSRSSRSSGGIKRGREWLADEAEDGSPTTSTTTRGLADALSGATDAPRPLAPIANRSPSTARSVTPPLSVGGNPSAAVATAAAATSAAAAAAASAATTTAIAAPPSDGRGVRAEVAEQSEEEEGLEEQKEERAELYHEEAGKGDGDGDGQDAEETEEERLAREEAESEALALRMMQEESMHAYQMQLEMLQANADQLEGDELAAYQIAMGLGGGNSTAAAAPIGRQRTDAGTGQALGDDHEDREDDEDADEDEDGHEHDDNSILQRAAADENEGEADDSTESSGWTYENLLALGDRLGNVKTENWRLCAAEHINKLLLLQFRRGMTPSNSVCDTKCLVCLGEYEDESEILRQLPCAHVFHRDCIDTWLGDTDLCPLCKRSITESAASANRSGGEGDDKEDLQEEDAEEKEEHQHST